MSKTDNKKKKDKEKDTLNTKEAVKEEEVLEETKEKANTAEETVEGGNNPLEAELEKKTEEMEKLKDQLMRNMAEYDNYRKRTSRERVELEPEITAKVLKRGARLYELPISYYGREFSEGKKITWRDGIHAIIALIKYRFMD